MGTVHDLAARRAQRGKVAPLGRLEGLDGTETFKALRMHLADAQRQIGVFVDSYAHDRHAGRGFSTQTRHAAEEALVMMQAVPSLCRSLMDTQMLDDVRHRALVEALGQIADVANRCNGIAKGDASALSQCGELVVLNMLAHTAGEKLAQIRVDEREAGR